MPSAEATPELTGDNMSLNPIAVKENFIWTPRSVDAFEKMLSSDRFATYLTSSNGDRVGAAQLYTWNTALSAAFYGPLQGLEVALRNAMHHQLSYTYGTDWFDNHASGLDARTSREVAKARAKLLKDKRIDNPPNMVAILPIGFWTALLGKGGPLAAGGKAKYEMTLWRPGLYRAFPNKRLNRQAAYDRLAYLRNFRNRIAHHEPIFKRHMEKDFASILEVAGWISPETGAWISYYSRVLDLLAQSSGDSALRF